METQIHNQKMKVQTEDLLEFKRVANFDIAGKNVHIRELEERQSSLNQDMHSCKDQVAVLENAKNRNVLEIQVLSNQSNMLTSQSQSIMNELSTATSAVKRLEVLKKDLSVKVDEQTVNLNEVAQKSMLSEDEYRDKLLKFEELQITSERLQNHVSDLELQRNNLLVEVETMRQQ